MSSKTQDAPPAVLAGPMSMGGAKGAECLAGGGEMGALMRSIDWSRTGLGPVARWPKSLKTMVSVMLANRFPMLIWWGPELLQLYNDAYRPVLGVKHPASMGAPCAQVWPEIWDIIAPMIRSVMDGGPAQFHEHLQLFLNSRGVGEETFFTFAYSPIPDDDGRIGGVLNTVQETTEQVQDDRQLRMLRDLAAHSADAKSAAEACRTAAGILAVNDSDLPFSLFYLRGLRGESDSDEVELVSASGLSEYHGPAKPLRVALSRDFDGWPLQEAERTGRTVIVEDLEERFGTLVTATAAATGRRSAPRQAVVLPLSRAGHPRPHGFFVAGVSPRRKLDERYLGLFQLTADQVMTAIANARSYEEARQRAEALAELNRAKTAFFSNVSHEFRTPLTLILGPVEHALSTPPGVLSGQELRAVHRNGVRLLKLVNTLLDFSRIEAGREQACYLETDLTALTVELASAFRSAIEHAGLRFVVDCPPLSRRAYVDHDMWEKIVLNLLSNALKFTFAGAITISLRIVGEVVELKVADTGTGIPAGELPHLFERFHRVHGARSRTHEGSGIGLALVHELVRMHGGTITVTSQVDRGSTFTVRIALGTAHLPKNRIAAPSALRPTGLGAGPYVHEALSWLPAPSAAPPPSEDAPAVKPATAGARILLADDNTDMRDYVRRLLAERWEVEAVADGAAALRAVRERPPDLILTDVMMPGLDGMGLLRELRSDPRTRLIPIIMLSARAGEEASMEGLAQGANDYLVKPFSVRELIGRVSAQLELARVQRLVEARLVQERQRLHTFLMEAPAAIAIVRGPRHVYELANALYRQLVGNRDILGKPGREALPELIGPGVWDIFDRIYATGQPFVGEGFPARLSRSDGAEEERYFNWVAQATHDQDGNIDGVMLVVIEVTEQVRARQELERARLIEQELRQAAEAASRAKDEFLALLGHELRNPLAPIATALHLMRLRGVTVVERERVVIERQVGHLTRLVDDLLDVSRITRGKVELQRRRIEIFDVVTKAIEMASPMLEQRQHHLALGVAATGLPVHGDLSRLAQVLSNLLTNAAKYTQPSGHIAVSARRDGNDIAIQVSDDGIGIAPELLPHVFELFMQERQALDRSAGGLGLGLAIVRSLVGMHGGSVSVHSEGKGRGSVFTIRLPAATEQAEVGASSGTWAPLKPSGKGRSVLVVDDNEDAAEVLASSLELLGHATRVAHDGPAALRILAEFRPDVALLDIGLPVMDGYELARRLRQEPSLDNLHLVAVTGYGQESDRQRSREAGFDAHLVKPIKLPELEALLKNLTEAEQGRAKRS